VCAMLRLKLVFFVLLGFKSQMINENSGGDSLPPPLTDQKKGGGEPLINCCGSTGVEVDVWARRGR
jgi:hypothetical protein